MLIYSTDWMSFARIICSFFNKKKNLKKKKEDAEININCCSYCWCIYVFDLEQNWKQHAALWTKEDFQQDHKLILSEETISTNPILLQPQCKIPTTYLWWCRNKSWTNNMRNLWKDSAKKFSSKWMLSMLHQSSQ